MANISRGLGEEGKARGGTAANERTTGVDLNFRVAFAAVSRKAAREREREERGRGGEKEKTGGARREKWQERDEDKAPCTQRRDNFCVSGDKDVRHDETRRIFQFCGLNAATLTVCTVFSLFFFLFFTPSLSLNCFAPFFHRPLPLEQAFYFDFLFRSIVCTPRARTVVRSPHTSA